MRLADFDFELPSHLIAQTPLPRRDASRMLVVHRATGAREHRTFGELPEILDTAYFIVLNNTRVFPARLRATRPEKTEEIEVLLVREIAPRHWVTLVKPARKAKEMQTLLFEHGLMARILEERADGSRVLCFEGQGELMPMFERIGETPLPPYIRRAAGAQSEDRERYQTVYARHTGSVAAPTAGLHFTPRILARLADKNIPVAEVMLHVGYGTFQPVRTERVESHRMEPEHFELSAPSAAAIAGLKSQGRKLVAVGTTTTRLLEHVASRGEIAEDSGLCDLFIYPGFHFRAVDGLLTNFHLPKSTLFMLVCAFAGTELMRQCYEEAISQHYRFFSYGDCMLLL